MTNEFNMSGIYDPRCPGGQVDPGPPQPSQTTTSDPRVPVSTQNPAYPIGPQPYSPMSAPAQSSHPYHNPNASQQAGAEKARDAGKGLPYDFEHFCTCSACDEQTYCAKGYGHYPFLCASCDAKMRGVK